MPLKGSKTLCIEFIWINLGKGINYMKCIVCNADLTDSETTIRHAVTKKFLDTCMTCIRDIGNLPIQVRPDLMSEVDLDMVDDLLDGNDDDFYDDSQGDDYDEYWEER